MKQKQKLRQAIDTLFAYGPATHDTYMKLALECFRANDAVQAKRLQTHMDTHMYRPNSTFLHNRLLHLYAKSGHVSHARNLFDNMYQKDVFSWNAMLLLYSNCGMVKDLWVMFSSMPYRDLVSYNTVISGLSSNGCASKAIGAFVAMQGEGFVSSEYSYVGVVNACSHLVDLRRGKQIHGRVLVVEANRNVFVSNSLVDMYAKCGEINKARRVFDKMENKNVVSWNSMISGYLSNGRADCCVELYRGMSLLGLEPDQVTVSNVLCAYFQQGLVDEASNVFREMREKDKVCWTTMIVGYGQNRKEEESLALFREMLLDNVMPDNFTISSVVSSCAKSAYLNCGQAIHAKGLLIGFDNDLLVSSALIDMYCKCGVTMDAWAVFSRMPMKNVVSWNAMIGGYARNGEDLEALKLYGNMLGENLKPDSVTFVGVLSACAHSELVEKGKWYFDLMKKEHGLTPTLDHYACMINLLGRAGLFEEALDLISSMPYEPDSLIWSTVLSVSATKVDIKHGEIAARHLFQLDPLNAGPYIMLSNMYAAHGRWSDVAAVRSLMKVNNVKKFAAYSWIEIDNEVHKFVADDRSHQDTKSIYAELNRLIKKLQEAGFIPNTNLVLHNVGEEEKFESICYHSEKLALAFGLVKKPRATTPIRIMKNIRVCGDCHMFMKFVSNFTGRQIVLRDSNRYHHFIAGKCSCKDSW